MELGSGELVLSYVTGKRRFRICGLSSCPNEFLIVQLLFLIHTSDVIPAEQPSDKDEICLALTTLFMQIYS